ncbi:UDP-N-acetylmuramoyl-L-alanyl-D-glutamate--2,6-diaminopimelate ligase [Methylobacillus caricis]|uniref:UDP-N-acetylmuramoyl-L-alanyl-D-glutamate--2, 6-diaminopimelate ligase n=1 Tax=Methylobacillus caricis TaxID=1971611 RepID=UPI001CFFE508|nr:UDP-N-acetylmuramoyl-L-alanyl-D-glutamate--2,6-diaminopimelate ligase [Methylobacillus caricis]MCB5188590.1 UDP-N-acetylmuramoyl-L-alanyl-D-glutamate--2,6-diaminopimelate ligase [Methylobacillus caricis]
MSLLGLEHITLDRSHFSAITADSRQVHPGSVFLAFPGEKADGRQFIAQAISQGAAAVLWEREGYDWDARWALPNQPVSGLRQQAGNIADAFYGRPSQQLWMIGVTGTNGKTSCAHWLAQAFTLLQRKTAVIGTLGNGFPGALSAAVNTTPDPILLHGMLADYLAQGAVAAAMEVSSHGLEQGRVHGVHFDVAVLTNLTRDHLDYHGDMHAYADAKKKLFAFEDLGHAILNHDDAFGRQLSVELAETGKHVLTYGLDSGDVRGTQLAFNESGLQMQVNTPYGNATVEAAVLGRFNAYNLLAVLATLLVSGVELNRAVDVLGQIIAAPGRMQQLGGKQQPLVVIDYAHTPDALEKALASLREQAPGRLVCVFGCGGNRDKGKRPLMAEVASSLADEVVVTSDNPRDEDPTQIIAEVVAGLKGAYQIEPDRALAITAAINTARAGDVVLVAGKGHEDYQEIEGGQYPFNDAQIAQQALNAWQRGGAA